MSRPAGEGFLTVTDLVVEFGGVRALDGPSMTVEKGDICGLIGPNGAGKTTLFNCINGIYRPSSGSIRYEGRELTALQRHKVATLGIGRTFQNVGLCGSMSILENVLVGCESRYGSGLWSSLLASGRMARIDREMRREALVLLDRLGLGGVAGLYPAEVPFGTLKRIELARALMMRPRLLLLDEPANGLSHGEVRELAELILAIRREFDLTIVLVEHHMGMVGHVTDHVVVLDIGRKIAEGTIAHVRDDPAVVRAYLGG
jgi:branched-chain amino acid transport system ATP-binding protein